MSGYNIAMNIIEKFPPRYWKKENYNNKQYLLRDVDYNSHEYQEVFNDIDNALYYDYTDIISSIVRVQNPYAYSRFMLKKKQLKLQNMSFYECRRFKFIPYDDIDLALKYNCDGRRLDNETSAYTFYSSLIDWPEDHVIFVLKVLCKYKYEKPVKCDNDSEFYIEYIIEDDDEDEDEDEDEDD